MPGEIDTTGRDPYAPRAERGALAYLASWVAFLTIAAGVVATLALLGGFAWFYAQVPEREVKLDRKADGIVVLTGGADRIPDAMGLLADAYGRRLLITGVHRATRAREIADLTPRYKDVFACCVDLDRSALNTVGNAVQTKHWVAEKRFHSLIVVTSNWHMPRAMVELEHHLPGVTLIPYPVVTARLKEESWWTDATTARLLISEYLKYLLALVRLHLDPDTPA